MLLKWFFWISDIYLSIYYSYLLDIEIFVTYHNIHQCKKYKMLDAEQAMNQHKKTQNITE
jgi:hypothetical protein